MKLKNYYNHITMSNQSVYGIINDATLRTIEVQIEPEVAPCWATAL